MLSPSLTTRDGAETLHDATQQSRGDSLLELRYALYAHWQIDPSAIEAEQQLLHHTQLLIAEHTALALSERQHRKDQARLMDYISQLLHVCQSIERSLAWRFGFRFVSLIKRLLGRPSGQSGFVAIHQIAERYRHWRKSCDE